MPKSKSEEPFVAASARAFASSYQPQADGKYDVSLVLFGATGHERGMNELGTFEIAGAIREKALDACGGCDDPKTNRTTSVFSDSTASRADSGGSVSAASGHAALVAC